MAKFSEALVRRSCYHFLPKKPHPPGLQNSWKLQDSLIVNLVKPFNVRMVLNSKSCPAAGEVWDILRCSEAVWAFHGAFGLKPGDSGDGKTCWNCWVSVQVWDIHLAVASFTCCSFGRNRAMANKVELPKGGGPWLGKSSTLGYQNLSNIYIYISNVWHKNISNILEASERECLLTGSVTGGLPFADNSGSVTLAVSVDVTMGPKSMSFGYSGDLCRGSLVANCARACHGTTSTEFGAEKNQWLLRPATLLRLEWWKMLSFLVFSTWWCRRMSWNCFNDSIFPNAIHEVLDSPIQMTPNVCWMAQQCLNPLVLVLVPS